MEMMDKLKILADAAKYDVSCSSSGSNRKNKGGVGNASMSGICHSWSADGRCISLLKILMTNNCVYDCAYCINRVTNDVPRAIFTPDEIADLTINFYRRNYIEGLFLSSAVFKTPDHTMELMIKAIAKLRYEYKFNGYIHVKVIPGADKALISQIGLLADRVSVNIELPTEKSLTLLAPQKKKENILKPMGFIKSTITQVQEEKAIYRHAKDFIPAGQTTQLIVGASPERDVNILRLSEGLYKSYKLKRVYYSGYVPVVSHPLLPSVVTSPPLLREHRLYQADWLLRFYGFGAEEILDEGHPDLSMEFDPKTDWAIRNIQNFPIEVNRADYEMLIRVPGIGVKSARRILAARQMASIDYELLKKFGVVLKRAKYFITCRGKYYGGVNLDSEVIKNRLLDGSGVKESIENGEQLTVFSLFNNLFNDSISRITGEL